MRGECHGGGRFFMCWVYAKSEKVTEAGLTVE